ncbi:hypothetical protein ABHV46_10960 [Asaia sp. BMEF1]|uniref:hypothetical protein n=1 Tax=Asaia sp. BMEF1 TaxID=3155932 RepID=UPI003F680AD6
MATEPTNALATIETLNPIAVFQTQGGVEDILSKLERDVRSIPTDPTTDKGRKEIKSLAYKVARSKTALDDMGKAVAEDARKTVDSVNASRRTITSRLDALRDEVRKPVDDYEAREQARIDEIKGRVADIDAMPRILAGMNIAQLRGCLSELETQKAHDFQEFSARAADAIQRAEMAVNAAIIITEQEEKNRIEAERKAAEEAEAARIAAEKAREQREAEIARQAAETARLEAERIAKAEKDRIENERRAAIAEAERAEQRRKDEAAQAERRRIAAAEQAERDRIAAVEAERKRVAEEKAAHEAEEKRRTADKAHRATINREVLADLVAAGLTDELAKQAISAIVGRKVRHVTLSY